MLNMFIPPLMGKKILLMFYLCNPESSEKMSQASPGNGARVQFVIVFQWCVGIPDHLTCLLRNLYAGQEATGRTGHGTTDWFQIGKGVHQGCVLSPCLFNLYAEYIMRNATLEETQAGIKIARRNINNLRYEDDTTFTAEGEKELKSLLMKVKAQHSENDHGIWSHHFIGNRWGNSGNSVRFYFGGLQNHCRWWLKPSN